MGDAPLHSIADESYRREALTPEPSPIGGFTVESDSTTAQRVSTGPCYRRRMPNRRLILRLGSWHSAHSG
jgi:hypothetical protein